MLFKQKLLLPILGFKNAAIKMNTRDLIDKIFPNPGGNLEITAHQSKVSEIFDPFLSQYLNREG